MSYKTLILTFFLLVVSVGSLWAAPDTCKVGVFLESLYDFDYVHQSYTTDFWLWSLTDTSHLHPLNNFEFPIAKSATISLPSVESKHGLSWSSEKCNAIVRYQWNTVNFPFDVQILRFIVEETDRTADKLVYAVDSINSKISPSIKLDGWVVSKLRTKPIVRTYASTYGDPELQGSTSFPAIEMTVMLSRHGLGLFFKLFSGVYIAFAIAMMVFFFKPDSEVRYSLAVGALFAAVANKYIIDSLLPPTVGFTLVDKVHVITFLYILGVVMFSGIAMHLSHTGKHADSAVLDKRAMWLLLVSYVAINLTIIARAII